MSIWRQGQHLLLKKELVWGTVHNIMVESGIKTVKRIEVDNQEII